MKVFFVSLGCDKNTVDSEKILKRYISNYHCDIATKPEEADIVMINTCSFILDAKKESIDYIRYFVKLKKQNIIKKIIVFGCLVAENNISHKYDDIFKDVDVDLSYDKYADSLKHYDDRVNDVLSFSSSIKICDGCDKFCSYCIIPYLRGRFKSSDKDLIVRETTRLAKNGTKELSIVGQDVLHYGEDLDIKKDTKKPIVTLIDELSKIAGIEWIRLLYCYPEEIDESVIDLIAYNKKVLHYIDMPIQHISSIILKLMNRKTTRDGVIHTIEKLRDKVPDIAIRTTFIVGFPGETDEDFEELVDFVKYIKFDKVGVFTYSREKLSRSYNFDGQISDSVKNNRKKILMNVQKDIVNDKNIEKIGNTYKALVEGKDTNSNAYIVRPYFNARDIDDKVYLKSDKLIISGEFVNIKITNSLGYDLEAVLA